MQVNRFFRRQLIIMAYQCANAEAHATNELMNRLEDIVAETDTLADNASLSYGSILDDDTLTAHVEGWTKQLIGALVDIHGFHIVQSYLAQYDPDKQITHPDDDDLGDLDDHPF